MDSGAGAVTDPVEVTRAIHALRSVFAAIEAGQLSCSAGYRNRIEGAVAALECLMRGELGDVIERANSP